MLRLRSPRTCALFGAAALARVAVALPALLLAACGGGAGHLVASVDRLDFGNVDHGSEADRRFRLKNDGATSVVIASLDSTCVCVHVQPGWRRSLAPGESTEVLVRLKTADVPPQKLTGKAVVVSSDDAKMPVLRIPVDGEILRRLTFQPEKLLIGPGDGAARSEPRRLRLRPAPGYEVRIDKIENLHSDWFEVAPPEKVPEGYDLLLSIKPDPARRGPVNSFVRLHVTVTGRGLPPQKYEPRVDIQGSW